MTYFVRQIAVLVDMKLYGAAAIVLKNLGYTFDQAYYILFKRAPRR